MTFSTLTSFSDDEKEFKNQYFFRLTRQTASNKDGK